MDEPYQPTITPTPPGPTPDIDLRDPPVVPSTEPLVEAAAPTHDASIICHSCHYWLAPPPPEVGRIQLSDLGECRRREPLFVQNRGTRWPMCARGDWCGEHSEWVHTAPMDAGTEATRRMAKPRKFLDTVK